MPTIGLSELLVILMILLLVFGGSRLPQIGESLGKTLRGFKRGLARDDRIGISDGKLAQGQEAPAPKSSKSEVEDADLIDKPR